MNFRLFQEAVATPDKQTGWDYLAQPLPFFCLRGTQDKNLMWKPNLYYPTLNEDEVENFEEHADPLQVDCHQFEIGVFGNAKDPISSHVRNIMGADKLLVSLINSTQEVKRYMQIGETKNGHFRHYCHYWTTNGPKRTRKTGMPARRPRVEHFDIIRNHVVKKAKARIQHIRMLCDQQEIQLDPKNLGFNKLRLTPQQRLAYAGRRHKEVDVKWLPQFLVKGNMKQSPYTKNKNATNKVSEKLR